MVYAALMVALTWYRGRTGYYTATAVVNVLFVLLVFFSFHTRESSGVFGSGRELAWTEWAITVGIMVISWVALVVFSQATSMVFWTGCLVSLVAVVLLKTFPRREFNWSEYKIYTGFMIGWSYLMFRTCRLAVEIRSGAVVRPGLSAFLTFCFYLPTYFVGPITSYERFKVSNESRLHLKPEMIAKGACRILLGLVKVYFLASVAEQMGLRSLLNDGHDQGWMRVIVGSVGSLLQLYFDFSGLCDIAIGVSLLFGIVIDENFDHPFAAPNILEFWRRWHMTLTHLLRDIVFTPAAKTLGRRIGVKSGLMVGVFLNFVIIGLWHGFGWSFLLFGLYHGLGVCIYIWWRETRLANYLRKKMADQYIIVRRLNQILTVVFFSLSMIFLTYDVDGIARLLLVVK